MIRKETSVYFSPLLDVQLLEPTVTSLCEVPGAASEPTTPKMESGFTCYYP